MDKLGRVEVEGFVAEGMYDYIKQLMALSFLPARHIQQTFDHLKTKAYTKKAGDVLFCDILS